MTISPPQAAKLRELVKSVQNTQRVCATGYNESREDQAIKDIESFSEVESQLDAYITSLTASAQTGD